MSIHDLRIVLAASICLLACLGGSAVISPILNAQRVELQYTSNEDLTKNLPPEYATWYIALGAFRGPMLNFLWIRLEDMKSEGKFWEMKQLSETITRLQPRFQQVWSNRAWNLAYNISVMTHTAKERWFWVQSGIELLRAEGIPHNPNSVLLYKELSWIFMHKIGMFSDDFHRYYKAKLAEEWHFVLGDPAYGMADSFDLDGTVIQRTDPEDPEKRYPQREWAVIAAFRPIAYSYEKYINRLNTPRRAEPILQELLADPETRGIVEPFAELPALRMLAKARRAHEDLLEENPERARRLAPLVAVLEELEQRRGEPLDRFLAGEPDCAPLVDELKAIGRTPGPELNEEVGRLRAAVQLSAKQVEACHPKLVEMFGEPKLDAPENREKPAAKILAFMRALTLDQKYHMNPLWMLELMEGKWFVNPRLLPELQKKDEVPTIPVDWRNPGAQGMYWAALGIKRSQGFRNPEDYDLLNIDRQFLMGIQSQMHMGKLLYDPFSGPDGGYYRQLPDLRFIEGYHHAVFGSTMRNPSERYKGAAIVESFQAGHENFLIWAVQQLYYAGEERLANRYYRLLRETFTSRDPRNVARYSKAIDRFVQDEMSEGEMVEDDNTVLGMVNSFFIRCIEEGLVSKNPVAAKRFFEAAKTHHRQYNAIQEKRVDRGPDDIDRMKLPPIEELFAVALADYLTRSSSSGIRFKIEAWTQISDETRRRIYDLVKPRLTAECQAIDIDPEKAFPEPEGMAQFREDAAKGVVRKIENPFRSETESGQR